jgi:hypothetical protein
VAHGNVVHIMPQVLSGITVETMIEVSIERTPVTESSPMIAVLVPMHHDNKTIHSLLLTHLNNLLNEATEIHKAVGITPVEEDYVEFIREAFQTLYSKEVIPFRGHSFRESARSFVIEIPWKNRRGQLVLKRRQVIDVGGTSRT